MRAFFQRYPVVLDELDAIKLIHKRIEIAEEKNKNKDPTYCKDLAVAYEMLEFYFNEKDINPNSLL